MGFAVDSAGWEPWPWTKRNKVQLFEQIRKAHATADEVGAAVGPEVDLVEGAGRRRQWMSASVSSWMC